MASGDFIGGGARYTLNKEVALTRGITEWASKFLAKTHREFIRAVKGGLVKSIRKADPTAPTSFTGTERELARLLSSYYVGVYKWNYKNETGAIAFGKPLKDLIDTANYRGNKEAVKRVGQLRAAHYDAGRAYIKSMQGWYLRNTGFEPTQKDIVRELSGLAMRGGPPARFPNRPSFVFAGNRLHDLSGERDPYKVSLRARVWARTELTQARNSGLIDGMVDAGIQYKKWGAGRDSKTRQSHKEVRGQVVPVDKPFKWDGPNGKVSAMEPGAVSLPAAERINCRCRVLPATRSEYIAYLKKTGKKIPAHLKRKPKEHAKRK